MVPKLITNGVKKSCYARTAQKYSQYNVRVGAMGGGLESQPPYGVKQDVQPMLINPSKMWKLHQCNYKENCTVHNIH